MYTKRTPGAGPAARTAPGRRKVGSRTLSGACLAKVDEFTPKGLSTAHFGGPQPSSLLWAVLRLIDHPLRGFGTSGLGLDNPCDGVNQFLVSLGDGEKTASGKRCGGAGRHGKPDTAGKAETRKPRKHGQLRGFGPREALTSGRGALQKKT
jgi:hypothetical protein